MWPFFTFYGGKWRAAPRYPTPLHDTIVEPFAGAAGYAVRHHQRQVILCEKDPEIAALWRYLIAVNRREIEELPLIRLDQSVDDLRVTPEARTLIGFWLNKGAASACKTPGAWMREGLRPKSFWGPEIRSRIAGQVDRISHWHVIEGGYDNAPNVEATWFIDPPYEGAGKLYRHSSKSIDFSVLGDWCLARRGQVMVCENDGADWLPFEPFLEIKSTEGRHGKAKSREALFYAADSTARGWDLL